jgi:hypothetical protein
MYLHAPEAAVAARKRDAGNCQKGPSARKPQESDSPEKTIAVIETMDIAISRAFAARHIPATAP